MLPVSYTHLLSTDSSLKLQFSKFQISKLFGGVRELKSLGNTGLERQKLRLRNIDRNNVVVFRSFKIPRFYIYFSQIVCLYKPISESILLFFYI